MITIRMNTERLKLTIEGHAQPEETSDYRAICSAVSAIAQGLAYSIAKYDEQEGGLKSLEYRNDPGNMLIRPWPEHWAESTYRHRFRNYGDGFELLAKSHPESVTFIRDGEKILPEEEGQDNE